MYKNNKKKNKIILFVALILSILLIVAALFFYDKNGERYFKNIFLNINKIIVLPFIKIKDSNCNYNQNDDVYDKDLMYEIEELKNILEVKNLLNESVKVNATVINRNLGYWDDTITIDKGISDGIEIGMPAVVKSGLIGKIIKTSQNYSIIRLVTSQTNNKISVKVETDNDYAYGLLTSYNKNNDTYVIEGISQTASIKDNANVTTTGLGDIFPSGILIGKVTNIKNDNYDLSQIIEVSPSVNFDSISIVTILKRNAK